MIVFSGLSHATYPAVVPLQGDGEIIALVRAVNEMEINAGTAASKSENTKIRNFGELMVKRRRQSLSQIMALSEKNKIAFIETEMVRLLREKSSRELASIELLSDKAFDISYTDLMITDLTEVLVQMDRDFIPSVKNMKLKIQLKLLRFFVARHLKKARKIRESFK